MLRRFSDENLFLLVEFQDENGTSLSGADSVITTRIKDTLVNHFYN